MATKLEVLLPVGTEAAAVTVNDVDVPLEVREVEHSRYVVLPLEGVGVHRVRVTLA